MIYKQSRLNHIQLTVLLTCLLTGLSTSWAKTRFVESWGADDIFCGTKAAPCRSIQHVINNLAQKNDKIIVGPGIYVGNLLIDLDGDSQPLTGLKLYSTAGRFGTYIQPDDDSLDIIDIRQSKVQIGKTGKGFSIGGTLQSAIGLVNAATTGVKIQGNLMQESLSGVRGVADHKLQVRNNLMKNVDFGIGCAECTDLLIQHNQIDDVSSSAMGISDSADASDKIMVIGNRILAGSDDAFGIVVNSNNLETLKIKDNVVVGNPAESTGNGIQLRVGRPSLVQGNISAFNPERGFQIQQVGMSKGGKVQSNLSLANNLLGYYLDSIANTRFDKNTAAQNGQIGGANLDEVSGIYLDSPVQVFSSFKNNNTWGHPDDSAVGCGITSDYPGLTYSKHFFGGVDGPDPTPGGTSDAQDNHCGTAIGNIPGGTFATKPNPVNVRAAAKL